MNNDVFNQKTYYHACVNNPCVPSYRPIAKFSIYSMSDLCNAFAEKDPVELEGVKGVITCLKRSGAVPENCIVVSIVGEDMKSRDCVVRIK